MQRSFVFFLLLSLALISKAQRHVVVVDIDTHIPIEGVSVKTDTCRAMITDSEGKACITERFDTIRFSHLKYFSEKITYEEFTDTMYLVAKNMMLPEVVVTGINPDLMRAMKKNHERMMLEPTSTSILTFDFANFIDRRARRDRKHYRKAKKILREWDLKN
ncbi:MAG: hypothetical protein SOZ80_09815 [Prevotella sp.]|uniref:hypothetical protein n=1 Tax=Prevotella sp. TaxID=59823 RepID=UPI002A2818AC|nr:hypothetical protein [Prevotella sp.]MDD7318060.1 hypothetical protein [Prevotellaceae bacterium]MDY4021051.1 hypothetical protein [Prevotella sp.]